MSWVLLSRAVASWTLLTWSKWDSLILRTRSPTAIPLSRADTEPGLILLMLIPESSVIP